MQFMILFVRYKLNGGLLVKQFCHFNLMFEYPQIWSGHLSFALLESFN